MCHKKFFIKNLPQYATGYIFTMSLSKELRGRTTDISKLPPAVHKQALNPLSTRSATADRHSSTSFRVDQEIQSPCLKTLLI